MELTFRSGKTVYFRRISQATVNRLACLVASGNHVQENTCVKNGKNRVSFRLN